MADEADMQVSQEETTAEQTAGESQAQEQTDTNDSVETTEQAEQTESSASTGETSTSTRNQEVKDDSKPISRRSAAYRIHQLVEENKALKQQQQPVQDDYQWEQQEDEKPDIAALIAKEVEKRLNPVISESSKAADDAEIGEFFTGEKAAERSMYEPRIREMWNQSQYKDVAASDLYKIAKFDELSRSMDSIKQQAVEEYKQAERQANESSSAATSNTSNRTGKTGKSLSDMTDAELLEHNERVKAGLV